MHIIIIKQLELLPAQERPGGASTLLRKQWGHWSSRASRLCPISTNLVICQCEDSKKIMVYNVQDYLLETTKLRIWTYRRVNCVTISVEHGICFGKHLSWCHQIFAQVT